MKYVCILHLGYYSSANSTSCTICSAGDDCSDPAVTPTPCSAGTYSNEGDNGCTNCAAGIVLCLILIYIYKKRCGLIANETTLHKRPNDTEINSYWSP